jgi:hypothetical protein
MSMLILVRMHKAPSRSARADMAIPITFDAMCVRLGLVLIKEGSMLFSEDEKSEYFLVPLRSGKKVDKAEIEQMARDRGVISDFETVVHPT